LEKRLGKNLQNIVRPQKLPEHTWVILQVPMVLEKEPFMLVANNGNPGK
jgi:hypothetical protein